MTEKIKKPYKNQRRKPKQARAMLKYNAVLDACSRVLNRQPYDKITMTEICLESDLPYATVYQYFENKDAMMIAWITRFFDQITVLISQQKNLIEKQVTKKKVERDLSAQVSALLGISLNLIAAHEKSMRVMFIGMPQLLTAKLLLVAEDKTVHLIKELFSQTIEENYFPDLDYQLHLLTRMLIGYILQSILSGRGEGGGGLDVDKDSKEIAFLVNTYLRERKIIA